MERVIEDSKSQVKRTVVDLIKNDSALAISTFNQLKERLQAREYRTAWTIYSAVETGKSVSAADRNSAGLAFAQVLTGTVFDRIVPVPYMVFIMSVLVLASSALEINIIPAGIKE